MNKDIKILVAGHPDKTINYVRALTEAGVNTEVSLDMEMLRTHGIMAYDGLLLPGGGDINPRCFGQVDLGFSDIDDVLDKKQFEILRMFVKEKKPVLGICRGHQLINVFFGGTVIQDLAYAGIANSDDEFAIWHTGEGFDSIHKTIAVDGSWLAQLYGTFFVTNSRHHQAVGELGQGLCPVQFSKDCIVEGLVHEDFPVISVQWHPERMCGQLSQKDTVDGAAVFEYFISLIG